MVVTRFATSAPSSAPTSIELRKCRPEYSSRYERRSLVVNSNKTFSAWAEIFGDPVAVAAMVDRLVHHAEVIVIRGDSYRLKGKGKEVLQPERAS